MSKIAKSIVLIAILIPVTGVALVISYIVVWENFLAVTRTRSNESVQAINYALSESLPSLSLDSKRLQLLHAYALEVAPITWAKNSYFQYFVFNRNGDLLELAQFEAAFQLEDLRGNEIPHKFYPKNTASFGASA